MVARVDNAGPHVALTFDDCFFPSSWNSILRTLARNRVNAAFFCPGYLVRAFPDLAARTVRAGHTIGSHGWDHALLASAYGNILWRLKRDRNVWWRWREAAVPYFRPPYGAYNSHRSFGSRRCRLSLYGRLGCRHARLDEPRTERDRFSGGPAGQSRLDHSPPCQAADCERPPAHHSPPSKSRSNAHRPRRAHSPSRRDFIAQWVERDFGANVGALPTGERSVAAGLASRLLRVHARIRRVLVATLRSHSDRDGPAEPFRARAAKTHQSLAVPVAGTAVAGTTVPSAAARSRAAHARAGCRM